MGVSVINNAAPPVLSCDVEEVAGFVLCANIRSCMQHDRTAIRVHRGKRFRSIGIGFAILYENHIARAHLRDRQKKIAKITVQDILARGARASGSVGVERNGSTRNGVFGRLCAHIDFDRRSKRRQRLNGRRHQIQRPSRELDFGPLGSRHRLELGRRENGIRRIGSLELRSVGLGRSSIHNLRRPTGECIALVPGHRTSRRGTRVHRLGSGRNIVALEHFAVPVFERDGIGLSRLDSFRRKSRRICRVRSCSNDRRSPAGECICQSRSPGSRRS